MDYNLEIDNIIEKIKSGNHKLVLLQLADGLKPEAKRIVDKIRNETKAECLTWLGSCYGACDIPVGVKQVGIDLIIQIGHNKFQKSGEW
ncbi:MAG: diphthamide synthesis protein [Candidatus Woesearchaeota archaeon]